MIFQNNELARAVVFFDGNGALSKQLNMAEFEAVLEGFVTMDELACQTAKACYLEIDANFHIQSAVFFLLPVTEAGDVHRKWHLPLLDLAENARKSKDLGGGAIRLACYSQCPIAHFRKGLWDPDLSPASNQLLILKKAIEDNRLGLCFRAPEATAESQGYESLSQDKRAAVEAEISSRLRQEYAQELRDRMAQLLKEQRLRIATSKSEFKAENLQQKMDLQTQLRDLQQALDEKDKALVEQQAANDALRQVVDGQTQKISAMREYFDFKLVQANASGDEHMAALSETIEADIQAKYALSLQDAQEALQMREVELLYRNELEVQLHDEIARLREANQKAMANTGEQLLLKLIEKGISLVSFQPGAGHLTIPLSDVARYLESPEAYAAEKCGVPEDNYADWLAHYRMPVCQQRLDDGSLCGENIDRVDNPLDYKTGDSNCCQACKKRTSRAHLRLAGA